jgi:lipopolysaccharide transport system ATP-binding protein
MSSDEVALRLKGVAKDYRIFERPIDRIRYVVFGSGGGPCRLVPALKGIDLELRRGETVGIVGSNGAGKSTLLQIICGTLQADRGEIEVNGRVSALLELGASFSPEYTGRENVRLNGLLMGLRPARIAEKMDDILAFADIGDFIDQPVRTYSSGMFARLAFAVAINVDPDILVIDEALAVGDEAFQRKCFRELERLKAEGATILFVSHSARAVIELCDRAVLMYKGEALMIADARSVVTQYQRLLYATAENQPAILAELRAEPPAAEASAATAAPHEPPEGEDWFDEGLASITTEAHAEQGAHIEDVRIEAPDGRRVNVLKPRARYLFRYRVRFLGEAERVRFAMTVKTTTGIGLGAQWSAPREEALAYVAAGTEVEVCLPFQTVLTPGTYFTNAGVQGDIAGETTTMHRLVDVVLFRVHGTGRSRTDFYVDITDGTPDVRPATSSLAEYAPS